MSDFDSPWKEAVDAYFEAFLEFFFPWIHEDVDWSRGYEMLDKDPARRQTWKLRLVKSLCERGLKREDIRKLFCVLDWILHLPKPLEAYALRNKH